MSENSTSKRRYTSTRRQAQAAETRRQIVAAAGKLFAELGYAGTTIEGIAREAGIAVQTVYASFGSKRAILTRLVEVSVGGDEAAVPILERPGPQAVRDEPDQQRQLRLFAHGIGEIMARMSPIFEIMRVAAKTEPEIAELLRQLLEERLQNMIQFVGWVAANGPLRDDLDLAAVGETVWLLTSAEVYHLLTVDRAWPRDQYEQWLSNTLITLLLPADDR
jgi:TetR/AcrR family transcriptional regulator, regulator of autoinduction and epiphytic fitness